MADIAKRRIPTQLDDFPAPTVNTYSLETTIAEKIYAILSLMEFSSRMKDYYDIYYLANKFDFDGVTLTQALKKTFENRGRTFTVGQFEQVMGFGLMPLIYCSSIIRIPPVHIRIFEIFMKNE